MTPFETRERTTPSVRDVTLERLRLAGLSFLVLGAGFVTVVVLAAAMVPGYDFRGAAISDLGTVPETALLFNASLVLVGVLNLAGGYLFYRAHGKRWLLAAYTLAGLGAVGTGLFPLDTGGLHGPFALLAFLFFNVQALGTASRLRGVMRGLSVVAGGVGLVFVVLMALGDAGNAAAFGPIGDGGTERMIVYPVMLWLVAFGGYLIAKSERSETAIQHSV
jgi:hypothetical membrane protein